MHPAHPYQAPDPQFGITLNEHQASQLSGLNRRLYFFSFTLKVALTCARKRSNSRLYEFSRVRAEIGLLELF